MNAKNDIRQEAMSEKHEDLATDYIDAAFELVKVKRDLERERESYAALKHSIGLHIETLGKEIEKLKNDVLDKDRKIESLKFALKGTVEAIESITEMDEEGVRSWMFVSVHQDVAGIVNPALKRAKQLLE